MNKLLLLFALFFGLIPTGSNADPYFFAGKGDFRFFYRIDCRFHNQELHWGVNFCYANAVYQVIEGHITNVHMGVGCDRTTLFFDRARVEEETTLDRFSPFRAATPGLEIFPQGQLAHEGTYTSVLDIAPGRFKGLCYVHPMLDPN